MVHRCGLGWLEASGPALLLKTLNLSARITSSTDDTRVAKIDGGVEDIRVWY